MGTKGTPRVKAREAGEKYYDGKPCNECGNTQRYSSTSALTCKMAHIWASLDEEGKKEHYARCREATRRWGQKYRENNREAWNEYHRDLRKRRGEEHRKYMRDYMREYYKANAEKLREYQREWKRRQSNG